MKRKVTVNIDSNEYERAKKNGVNISSFCTMALKQVNDAIEHRFQQNKGFSASNSFTKTVAGGVGFEPTTPNLGEWNGTAEDWQRFREWLKQKNYRGGHDRTVFNYAQEYGACLFSRDLSRVRDLRDSLRPNIIKALACLAKFTGRYEDWKGLVKNYGLSWQGRNKDDVFIDRLRSVKDTEEIWNWVREVKQVKPDLSNFMDLMSVSGLRFVEGINSFNLVSILSAQGKLSEYYKDKALEHWRYKETFLRNTKKAFVSFVPSEIVTAICRDNPLPAPGTIQKAVKKKHLPLRFSDIREAHATFLTKFLNEPEINFLHGRVTSSVFMANYFNPALISDLKARVFQGIVEIQEKIKP